jgi:hypothetical protein
MYEEKRKCGLVVGNERKRSLGEVVYWSLEELNCGLSAR